MDMVWDVLWQLIKAFVVGGAICAVCQIFIDKTKVTPARILVSLVVLGVALTAIGVYRPLVEFAGAGATVPLLGFGYLLAGGVQEAVAEQGLLGALSGGLTAAAVGVTATIVFSYIVSLIAKSKDKS